MDRSAAAAIAVSANQNVTVFITPLCRVADERTMNLQHHHRAAGNIDAAGFDLASYSVVRQAAAVDHPMGCAMEICERIASVLFMLVRPVMIASAAAIWILSGQSPLIAHRR